MYYSSPTSDEKIMMRNDVMREPVSASECDQPAATRTTRPTWSGIGTRVGEHMRAEVGSTPH